MTLSTTEQVNGRRRCNAPAAQAIVVEGARLQGRPGGGNMRVARS